MRKESGGGRAMVRSCDLAVIPPCLIYCMEVVMEWRYATSDLVFERLLATLLASHLQCLAWVSASCGHGVFFSKLEFVFGSLRGGISTSSTSRALYVLLCAYVW